MDSCGPCGSCGTSRTIRTTRTTRTIPITYPCVGMIMPDDMASALGQRVVTALVRV